MTKKSDLSKKSADELLDAAHDEGALSDGSRQALRVVDLGAQIQAGLGISVDDVESSEVLLVTMMPDDSGSIQQAGNAAAVREGHNAVLDALGQSRQAGDVLVHTRYLNGEILCPYTPLAGAVRMSKSNYDPSRGTPLYDQTVALLGTVIAKSQELADAGVAVRTVTLLLTDGADMHSTQATADQVRSLVTDMLAAERHTIAALGIADGTTDFRAVFRSMGIADGWILTPRNTGQDIRRAFQVFSQSAVAISQGAAMATGLRGFVN